ncbi:MAG: hemerythrin domain-containing protein [Chitinophagaceae bacterium]|nr:hemerythrin domain-containing protein [Chitinophagaceae bacterium]
MAIHRHIALQPLSKQHHQALLVSLLLEKGLKKKVTVKELRDFAIQFWEQELAQHFDMEEKVFVPYSILYPDLINQFAQLKLDHKEIRLLIQKINNDARADQYETIGAFAVLLEKHIRFEERELFNSLQDTLSDIELIDVLQQLESIPEKDFCTRYPVKFWE